jgi:hypothetical protein
MHVMISWTCGLVWTKSQIDSRDIFMCMSVQNWTFLQESLDDHTAKNWSSLFSRVLESYFWNVPIAILLIYF